jgi:hypothetical protein
MSWSVRFFHINFHFSLGVHSLLLKFGGYKVTTQNEGGSPLKSKFKNIFFSHPKADKIVVTAVTAVTAVTLPILLKIAISLNLLKNE